MNSNNQKGSHDVDILGWVCDELAPPQAEAVQRAAGDPTIAQKANELRSAFLALASEADNSYPADQPAPSSFTAALRQRWEAELRTDEVPSSPLPRSETTGASWRRWIRLAIAPLAAAAAIAVFMAWPSGQSHFPPNLAWADVVSAVMRVDHFHITSFEQRPRSVNGPKMHRMDMFYQQPGKFRLQGLDRVQFIDDGKLTAIYDVKTQSLLIAEKIEPNPLAGFIAQFQCDGLLPAVISFVFRGAPPSAEPVKSTDADPTPGIEVFDYARDANSQWARIWVAKESRLPVRLKIFHPQSDGFMLVDFDYSDRQPAAFFDAGAFADGLKHVDGRDAERVYLIGTEPVAGRLPQGSSQISPAQGPFKPPVGKKAWAATNGDIAIAISSPRNYGPHGETIHARMDNICDTWGNEYVEVTWFMPPWIGDETPMTVFFTPKTVFHVGSGERKFSMDLLIQELVPGEAGSRKGKVVSRKVGRIELLVPPADDSKMPKEAAKYLTTDAKVSAFWIWADESRRPLAEKEAICERWAQQAPKSLTVRLWQVNLLLEANERAKAWDLFRRELLDESLKLDVLGRSDRCCYALARYVFHLYATGEHQQGQQIVEQLRRLRAQAATNQRMWNIRYRHVFEGEYNCLYEAMQIPERLKKFDAGPKPSVGQVVAGRDGMVAFELKWPGLPDWCTPTGVTGFNGGGPSHYWQSPEMVVKGGKKHFGYCPNDQSLWLLVKPAGPALTVEDTIPVLGLWSFEKIMRTWKVKIDVPAPTVDSARDWMLDKATIPAEQRRLIK
jgi:hypothetical protein